MKSAILLILVSFTLLPIKAQQIEGDFKFGNIPHSELTMSVYPKDSSANAVVLNEFGKAQINLNNDYYFRLFFYYHKKVKILKKEGFDQATFLIPLHKGKSSEGRQIKEAISKIQASTYNFDGGVKSETKFDPKSIFIEENKNRDIVRLTLPNIKEGSVIEISYSIESPYLFNFRSWYFQEDIPKIYSEYWSKIPGTHNYNISLKGFYNLSKTDSELVTDCVTFGGAKAGCSLTKFAMKDIPAFQEEEYMTSRNNFISSINFELKEVTHLQTGVVDKVTKEWKDADYELKQRGDFGSQFKRGRASFWDEKLGTLISGETDTLVKAKKVYEFIKSWYTWNEYNGMLCEHGIKKAYDKRSGDAADINLSLVSALRYAGIDANPIILSTRENGLPIELYPVLSDFNYVIGHCKINGKEYFIDATERYLPFGMLPTRCMNGKGRFINEDFKSEWIQIPNKDKTRKVSMLNLKLEESGNFKGTIENAYYGYNSFLKRKEIAGFNNVQEYITGIDEKLDKIKILSHEVLNLEDLDSVLTEKLEVEIQGFDDLNPDRFLLDPYFLGNKWKENPFKSKERLYPVDFGVPLETVTILQLEIPENLKTISLPERVGLALPSNGGKFLMNVQQVGNKIVLNNTLSLQKPIYSSQEYHYLKAMFNKMVQAENVDLIFEKKQ